MWLVSYEKSGICTQTYRHKGKLVMRWWRQRLEWCFHKPRNAKVCQQPPEATWEFFSRAFGEHGPADTLILDFYPSGLSEISFNHLICGDLLSSSRKLIQAGILIQDHELCQMLVLFNISLGNVFKPQLYSLKKSMISKPDKDRTRK